MIASATVAGINPLDFIRVDSDIELEYLQLVAQEAIEIQGKQRADLANRITYNIAKLFGVKTRS